jgi:hypothetical protein
MYFSINILAITQKEAMTSTSATASEAVQKTIEMAMVLAVHELQQQHAAMLPTIEIAMVSAVPKLYSGEPC